MFQISKRSILHDPEVGLRGLSPPLMGKKTGGVFLKFSQRYGVELSLLYRPCAPQLRLSYCHTEKGCMRGPELLESFFFFLIYFIYLFMAVLGPRFCVRAFSSCGKRGPLFIAARGPLTTAASLVADHRLQTHRLSNCGSWAQLLRGMWDPPRPGLEPVSPALAGRLSTTAPPGKPLESFLKLCLFKKIFLLLLVFKSLSLQIAS